MALSECFRTSFACLSRFLFMIHGLVAVWKIAVFYGVYGWILCIGTLGIFVEGAYVIFKRRGVEISKSICPTVLFYLIMTVPCVWMIKMHSLSMNQEELSTLFSAGNYDSSNNSSKSSYFYEDIDIPVSDETFEIAIVQSMLLLILLGKWLLPHHEAMTRQQLSEQLIGYVGVAADIIDLLDIFTSDWKQGQDGVVYAILAVYSVSLFQFTFALPSITSTQSQTTTHKCWNATVASILIATFMHDAPFLIVRLVTIIHYRIVTYTNIFFAAKNVLIISLQGYKLYGVCVPESEHLDEGDVPTEHMNEEAIQSTSGRQIIPDVKFRGNSNVITSRNRTAKLPANELYLDDDVWSSPTNPTGHKLPVRRPIPKMQRPPQLTFDDNQRKLVAMVSGPQLPYDNNHPVQAATVSGNQGAYENYLAKRVSSITKRQSPQPVYHPLDDTEPTPDYQYIYR
ncbi:unnamed protein product [Owenia fusiformis]|uniref:Uncharacterized protein n=1 Tax=Owenia fusiformis TaxID=6347 RepID=A0A8J1U978_OWEFU|nr:unnamed protein product [Owenia fusiformis]